METDDFQPQGRIVTENPGLLALLQDSTNDDEPVHDMRRDNRHTNESRSVTEKDPPIRRVYVDSPISNRTDDEYQFVNPNLDDIEEVQDSVNPEDLRNPHPGSSTGHSKDHSTDQMYYGENDQHGSESSMQDTRPKTQYVKPSRHKPNAYPGIEDMQPHMPSDHVQPQPEVPGIIKPIQSPLSKASQQEQEELMVLQREQEYQQQLRDKIMEQSQKADQIQIPRLALETLDDEEKPNLPMYHLHDSLEDEYIVGDSLEERQARSALLKTQQQLEHLKQQQMFTQQQLQQLQEQQQLYAEAQQHIQQQQDGYILQDSLDQSAGSMAQYYPLGEYQMNQDQGQEATGQNSYYLQYEHVQQEPQHGSNSGTHNYAEAQQTSMHGYQEEQGLAGQIGQTDQTLAGHQQGAQSHGAENIQYYTGDQASRHMHVSHGSAPSVLMSSRTQTSSKSSPSRFTRYSPPKQDYIKRNKEELIKGPERPTYKKLFVSKKELKEHPLLPPKMPTPQKAAESGKPSDTPQSIEDLWAIRAQRLEQEKQKKIAQGKKRSPLKKYPSDSKVNSLPDSAASIRSGPPVYGNTKPPYHVQPLQQRPIQQSVAEPIKSEIYSEGAVSPGGPIRHTIVTEDGQRLSVDINLKVLSPRSQLGFQQQSPGNQLAYGADLKMQAAPSSYQQNPAAFRPHMRMANQQLASGFPNQSLSPQHQVPLPGYYGNVPPSQGYNIHPQTHDLAEEYVNQQEVKSHHSPSPHPSLQSNTPIDSPYKILPAIGSADTHKATTAGAGSSGVTGTSPGDGSNGSYMAQYKYNRNKKHEYKVYTLEDYRKLKKEISLGGLGPDIENETVKEKRERRQRQLEYAKALKQKPPLPVTPGRPKSIPAHSAEEDDTLDKRKVALEYAKSVPKPKPRQATREQASSKSSRHPGGAMKSIQQEKELEIIDLEKLRQRHEKERQQVALIRQNLANFSQA